MSLHRRVRALLVAPALAPTLAHGHAGRSPSGLDRRDVWLATLAMGVAVAASVAAEVLIRAIALATNLAYFGRWSLAEAAPRDHHLGALAFGIPILGGLVVGLMARYGSRRARHGMIDPPSPSPSTGRPSSGSLPWYSVHHSLPSITAMICTRRPCVHARTWNA